MPSAHGRPLGWGETKEDRDSSGMQNITSRLSNGSIGGRHCLDFRPMTGESRRGIDEVGRKVCMQVATTRK